MDTITRYKSQTDIRFMKFLVIERKLMIIKILQFDFTTSIPLNTLFCSFADVV